MICKKCGNKAKENIYKFSFNRWRDYEWMCEDCDRWCQ